MNIAPKKKSGHSCSKPSQRVNSTKSEYSVSTAFPFFKISSYPIRCFYRFQFAGKG